MASPGCGQAGGHPDEDVVQQGLTDTGGSAAIHRRIATAIPAPMTVAPGSG
jgi:hypothetical protein